MKKFLLSIIFFSGCLLSVQAQILYGTTSAGGSGNAGAINRFSPATNDLTVVHTFERPLSGQNYHSFIQASDGKLYAMITSGGINGAGLIFSFEPSTHTYSKVKDLDSAGGGAPYGSLLMANDGKLYGMTVAGGANNMGVIFSFDPLTSIYTKLFDFDGTNGSQPQGSLIQASDGKLYGAATQGGNPGSIGVIFSFDLTTLVYTKLHEFTGTDGYAPNTLFQANNGKLYGTTYLGGANDRGIIFSFDPVANVFMKLKDLSNTDGAFSRGSLIQESDGRLYGVTIFGGNNDLGVIFSFDILTSTYRKLKDLDNANGGTTYGSLVQGTGGELYGVTSRGGATDNGVIFSFNPVGAVYTKLTDLEDSTGAHPQGSLLLANDGNLYGIANTGAGQQNGAIFSFNLSNLTYTVEKEFFQTSNGWLPRGNLLHANDGKLYGTAQGGDEGTGVIFSFDPATSVYTKLHDFDSTVYFFGLNGNLLQANNGKIYGMSRNGGNFNVGFIFSFDPVDSVYTKLLDFDTTNGSLPWGGLIQASDGNIYGMTSFGGVNGGGVIFSLNPLTSVYTKLKDLNQADGVYPIGGLIQAKNGKLYGTTNRGGTNGAGVLFSFDPSISLYTILLEFEAGQGGGGYPWSTLIQAPDGTFYGTGWADVDQTGLSSGEIFSFNDSTSIFRHANFGGLLGSRPKDLIQASDGKIYGMTNYGPVVDLQELNYGTIFSVDPSTFTVTKLLDFNNANGANPTGGFIEAGECVTSTTWYQDMDGDSYGNPGSSLTACTQPTGYVADSTDCNDNDQAVHGPAKYYRDADGDSYGNPTDSLMACVTPAGYVSNKNDCDDNNNAVHSGTTYYRDADWDGFGDSNSPISVCNTHPPHGYVRNNLDCNDHKRGWFWNERIKMCYNGIEACVRVKYVLRRLHQGWTLGPCAADCNNRLARNNTIETDDELTYNKQPSAPLKYKLSNYPNPFGGNSTIKYELPFDSKVSIKVYDGLGRSVSTLVDEYKKAGTYTVSFNAGRLSSGTLYYRIIAKSKEDHFEQTNQMIKIK